MRVHEYVSISFNQFIAHIFQLQSKVQNVIKAYFIKAYFLLPSLFSKVAFPPILT